MRRRAVAIRHVAFRFRRPDRSLRRTCLSVRHQGAVASRNAVRARRPTLGICLGAQLKARALGAREGRKGGSPSSLERLALARFFLGDEDLIYVNVKLQTKEQILPQWLGLSAVKERNRWRSLGGESYP